MRLLSRLKEKIEKAEEQKIYQLLCVEVIGTFRCGYVSIPYHGFYMVAVRVPNNEIDAPFFMSTLMLLMRGFGS